MQTMSSFFSLTNMWICLLWMKFNSFVCFSKFRHTKKKKSIGHLTFFLQLSLCSFVEWNLRVNVTPSILRQRLHFQKSILIQSLHRNSRRRERWETGEKCKDDSVCNSNVVGRGLRSVRRAVSLGEAYPWLGYILPCWLKRHEAAGGNHGSRDFCQRDSPVIAEQLSCNLKHI